MERHSSTRRGLTYEPGLDGLRALAIVAVLLFHAGFEWAPGGFLGVSLFFTLSGFLITRLLLAEHEGAGHVDLRAFWGRRLRRLLPAAVAGVLLVLALAPWIVEPGRGGVLRGDVWGAATSLSNWRFLLAGDSYADLFAAPSPLQHYWSLAIEGQFYLVFPLVVLAVVRRRGVAALGVVTAALLALSALASIATTSSDVVYYGTHTRAAELLAGALAAIVSRRAARGRVLVPLGGLALAALGFLVMTVDVTTPWLAQGGFVAIAALSATVVVASTRPGGLRTFLGERPLVAIGTVSYGLYVFHWPLFQLLTPERVGADGIVLFTLRVSVTAAFAIVSYRLVEQPVRRRRALAAPRRAVLAFGGSLALVAVLVVPVTAPRDQLLVVAGNEVTDFDALGARDPAAAAPTTIAPRRVAILGTDPAITRAVRQLDGVVIDMRPRCAVLGCEERAEAEAPHGTDLVVLALSAHDRASVRDLPTDDRVHRYLELGAELAALVRGYSDAMIPVVLTDTARPDYLTAYVDALDLGSDLVTAVRPRDVAVTVETRLREPSRTDASDGRLDVMVIGDSTSYGVAASLDLVASDRMHVLWAGGPNCPLVTVDRLRWSRGNEFSGADCPTVERWADLARDFGPDVLLVVSSFAEQTELRLPGRDDWIVATDEPFRAAHDDLLQSLLSVLRPYRTKIVVADSPPFAAGPFGGSAMASAARIRAWNEQIARWDRSSPSVATLGWTAILAALEAEEPIRPDGVHVVPLAHEGVGERVAAALDALVGSAR